VFQGCHVRRRIDTAGESRGDDETFERELGGDLTGEFLSHRRAVACADNGDDGDIGEVEPAFGIEQRRRCIDLGKCRRIAGLADGNQVCSKAIRGREFGLGFGRGAKADVGASLSLGSDMVLYRLRRLWIR
jgi:hypothetical protein